MVIKIKPIRHPYRNKKHGGLWYHFRYDDTTPIPELLTYFNEVYDKKITIYDKGHLELFDRNLDLVEVEGSILPESVKMALKSKDKVSAHTKVQKYLLTHDIFSVATEIPVTSAAYEVSGFIDLIRCSPDIIQILDYKPPGTERGVEGQLERYRQLLQMNTGTNLPIIVGYFNERGLWCEELRSLGDNNGYKRDRRRI